MNALVSVILPVWNGEQLLDRALASVLSQTHQNLEVVIVDDGSSDGTQRLIARWLKQDKRVFCLQQSQAGVASARNRAIAEARGEFIAPLDHDDIWANDKLETQLAVFSAGDERLALVSSGWARIDTDDRILSQSARPIADGGNLKVLAVSNYIVSSSIPLMRRSAVIKVGGYCEALHAAGAQGCEDYLLYLRLAEHYTLAHVPKVLVGYRVTANSMSQDTDQMIRSYLMVTNELSARHPMLAGLFQPGLVRLQRHKCTRALRRGDWGKGLTVALHILTNHPFLALFSFAAGVFNVLRRLWLCQKRASAAVSAPQFLVSETREHLVSSRA